MNEKNVSDTIDDLNDIVSKSIKVEALNYKLEAITKQIQSLLDEHKARSTIDPNKVEDWFSSLPIESLYDSLSRDLNLDSDKFSLIVLKEKFAIAKEYRKLIEEADKFESELTIAKIEFLQADIDKEF